MHIFHKWGKWEEYEQRMTNHAGLLMPKNTPSFESVENWQQRTCETCGFTQREEVKPS